ncbi:MAG: PAS domain-containing protein [Bdellovibrionales bacterium]|nr:PAS domain-containing protein [Bdellovibrionales bacterium]
MTNQLSNLPMKEKRKRRNEKVAIVLMLMLFLILTWIEFRLFEISQTLPFVHSIFFFGLVNFNLILFLFILFMIFRNIVKVFAEEEKGFFGRSLKSKLLVAFTAFSFVPTVLMFLISVFYINNSFEKWFSKKMVGVLKSSFEVTNSYHERAKNKNFHFAQQIANGISHSETLITKQNFEKWRDLYHLDAIEYYPGLLGKRKMSTSLELNNEIPRVSLETLKKAVLNNKPTSLVHDFSKGNLIRAIVPTKNHGAIVVSTFVPLSLLSRMDDIEAAYQEFRDINPLKYHLKSGYHVLLVLMTLTIILFATWFAVHLAKQLSIPLDALAQASRQMARGFFDNVQVKTNSRELKELVTSFNTMSKAIEKSENEVKEANVQLRQTLSQLDKHSRYIEVVLSSVSTGVISVDKDNMITMINKRAEKLLEIEADDYIGQNIQKLIGGEHYSTFLSLISAIRDHRASSIQREMHITVGSKSVPLSLTLSVLYDDERNEIGKVVVFDDLTPVVNAQRAVAWREVARRIAHEIKNPLTPIKLSAQRLNKKFGAQVQDEAFDNCTQMIIEQVDDLKRLVNEFSQFARLPKAKPVISNLNSVIDQSLLVFQSTTIERSIDIDFKPDKGLPDFSFDPEQIKRVMTNVIDNSLKALEGCDDPHVVIRTRYDETLKIVRISVIDNGIGIPKDLTHRVFEPYVTTKANGTGLGLAIVKRTIEDHNGFIRAFAQNPKGTKIIIELPVIILKNMDVSYNVDNRSLSNEEKS